MVIDEKLTVELPVLSRLQFWSLFYFWFMHFYHMGAIMLSLYAGDMLLLINLNTDLSHLQLDINSNDRVNKKITHLNPTKCKAILISLGNCSILQYGALVQHVDTFGVLLLWNQTWSSHINSICLKTRKLLRLLYRRLYGNVFKGRLKIYSPLGSLA